jgi:hypothetical protein
MWLQRFPRLDTTGLYSAEVAEDIVLDWVRWVRYAKKQENKGFFSNVITVL